MREKKSVIIRLAICEINFRKAEWDSKITIRFRRLILKGRLIVKKVSKEKKEVEIKIEKIKNIKIKR